MSWWTSLFGRRAAGSMQAADRDKSTAPLPPSRPVDSVPRPQSPQSARMSDDGFPNSFNLPPMGGAQRFDPALKHYDCAFGEDPPAFDDHAKRLRWEQAREDAIAHVLRAIAGSVWRDRLLLRGSATMRLWFGDDARVPHDLDWVVLPKGTTSGCDDALRMLDDVTAAVTLQASGDSGPRFDPSLVARDPIWTYERADGVRLTFGWSVAGVPPGKLQCDFVFGEELWGDAPLDWRVPAGEGEAVGLQVASPELSLAWKYVWLANDRYPQAKDLYDAVLLAERCPYVPVSILDGLRALLERDRGSWWLEREINSAPEERWTDLEDIDWKEFAATRPGVDPDLASWLTRWRAAAPRLLGTADAVPSQ